MSPKRRTTNFDLPPRVYYKHGAYYLVTPAGKWIWLGKTKREMYTKYYDLIERPTKIYTMNDLFDRYMKEVAPLKAPRTYSDNQIEVARLRAVFGQVNPETITPVHVYQYLDARALKAKVRANREKALLSSVFSYAIRWGVVKDNPCRNVKRLTEKPRTRNIEDWEFIAVDSISPEIIQLIMEYAYLTGQRKSDILKTMESDITDKGIKIIQDKTKEKLLMTWNEPLKICVDRARKLRGNIRSMYIFCRRDGRPYTESGFNSMWQRVMNNALEKKLIKERFTFHDIRAKSYTDEKTAEGRRRLGHKSAAMGGTYDRGFREVTPGESIKKIPKSV